MCVYAHFLALQKTTKINEWGLFCFYTSPEHYEHMHILHRYKILDIVYFTCTSTATTTMKKTTKKGDRNGVAKRTHQKLGPLGLMINVVNARQSIYLDVPVKEKVFVSFLFIHLLASSKSKSSHVKGKFVTKSYLLYHNQYHTPPPCKFSRLFSYSHQTLKKNIYFQLEKCSINW